MPEYTSDGPLPPSQFVRELHDKGRAALGEAEFDRDAHRYFLTYVKDVTVRGNWQAEVNRLVQAAKSRGDIIPEEPDWNTCSKAFITVTFSTQQRRDCVHEIVRKGLRPYESYKDYASRVRQEVRNYDLEDEASVFLAGLRKSVPDAMDHLLTKLQNKTNDYTITEIKDFQEFCSLLGAMNGPVYQ
ncbi:hypothetical protein DFQ27_000953, partial [Actinomortierella ambigua]